MIKFLCLVGSLCVIAGCGRKNRSIFEFDNIQKLAIRKLALGVPRITEVSKSKEGNVIIWKSPTSYDQNLDLLGYNIYRLTSHGLIPKQPLNDNLCAAHVFIDSSGGNSSFYVVRAVFSGPYNFKKEGPLSNIKMCS